MELRTRKIQEALDIFSANATFISDQEKRDYENKRLALKDSIISLKTHVPAGVEVPLLSAEKNDTLQLGVVDFKNGILEGINGKGSIAVTELKIGFAVGVEADAVTSKSFGQTTFPADFEHSILEISQEGKIVEKVKISEFVLKGDASTTFYGSRKHYGHPFLLAGNKATEVRLRRPNGVVGAEGFLCVDFIGMQAVAKRS